MLSRHPRTCKSRIALAGGGVGVYVCRPALAAFNVALLRESDSGKSLSGCDSPSIPSFHSYDIDDHLDTCSLLAAPIQLIVS